LEKAALSSKEKLIIQDTDYLTIWIWYLYKYRLTPDRVYNYLQRHLPDLYLLCYPDLEWEYDPLRENQHDLLELYDLYLKTIKDLKVPYTIIKGQGKEREEVCVEEIEKLL